MKYLALMFTLIALLSTIGCFKKKKEPSEWARYKAGVESAIDSLRALQSLDIDSGGANGYPAALEKTEGSINQFLQANQAEPERASHAEVAAALQDFRLVAKLIERKRSSSGRFFADKLLASTDTELFNSVKKKYQLGPEMVIATQPYYFIDSVIHEAWRSAGNHIARAESRLAEEEMENRRKGRAEKENISSSLLQRTSIGKSANCLHTGNCAITKLSDTRYNNFIAVQRSSGGFFSAQKLG